MGFLEASLGGVVVEALESNHTELVRLQSTSELVVGCQQDETGHCL
jgi:hypothetical protein